MQVGEEWLAADTCRKQMLVVAAFCVTISLRWLQQLLLFVGQHAASFVTCLCL